MKRMIYVILCLALVTGCATQNQTATKAMMEAQIKQMSRSTLEVDCPSGCKIAYTDPRDRQSFKLPTNGWDSLNNIVSVAGGVIQSSVMPLAFAHVAAKGFESLKGSGQVTTTTTTTTTNDSHNVDNTHTPTVVTQPSPVIVTQPSPLVVQPPVGKICYTDPTTNGLVCV